MFFKIISTLFVMACSMPHNIFPKCMVYESGYLTEGNSIVSPMLIKSHTTDLTNNIDRLVVCTADSLSDNTFDYTIDFKHVDRPITEDSATTVIARPTLFTSSFVPRSNDQANTNIETLLAKDDELKSDQKQQMISKTYEYGKAVIGFATLLVTVRIAYHLWKLKQKHEKHYAMVERVKQRFDELGVKPFVPKAPKPPKSPAPGACACPTQSNQDNQDNYQSVDSATYASGGDSLSAGAAGAAASVVPVKQSAQEKKKARRGIGTHTRRGGFKPRTQVPVSPSAMASAAAAGTIDTKREKKSAERYIIMRTAEFARAYEDVSDADRARIDSRMHDAQYGRFGDHHARNSGSNSATRIDAEFRWPIGLRVYFTIVVAESNRTLYLLRIGDKSSTRGQDKDIKQAIADADAIHAILKP